MIASVYIKGGNIHIYNEKQGFSELGGMAYALGRPLLDFVCYEPERFREGFVEIASAFDTDFAYMGAMLPEFRAGVQESLTEMQQKEIYVYFYGQLFWEFLFAFLESPKRAVLWLDQRIPGAAEKLAWAMDWEWPKSDSPLVAVTHWDKERRLHRAALDVVDLMQERLRSLQALAAHEIEVLLHYRQAVEVPSGRSLDYLDILDEYHKEVMGGTFYLERPFRMLYGRTTTDEIAALYEINTLEDLFRFEFIQMIEQDIYIKKCKNCGRFFLPLRRADAEYCDRPFADTGRKCREIGATLRYEKKVAENPILEAHKRAYRRLHSRVRHKTMTQEVFRQWSEESILKRDACLAGTLPFDEFFAWLEQGKKRKRG